LTEEQPLPAKVRPAARAKRVSEWFWRGAALAEEKRAFPAPSARAATLAQRACSSADFALNAAEFLRSADAASTGVAPAENLADASACDFYRQSVYWSLCARAALSDDRAGTSHAESIWDTLDEQSLASAAKGERRELLRTSLRSGSFVYFVELPESEQTATRAELRRLAESLLQTADERTRAVQGVLLQRAFRLSLALLALLLIALGLVWERKTREDRNDLARNTPWHASSKMDDMGCHSPAQECAESSAIFFHTKEERDPWIEFDLGSERRVSTVQVDNRADCCSERTIPLVVEVSDNHKQWRTVARQGTEFKTWRATFASVKTRWVRLRVARVSFLHLARVRIFS